MILNPDDLSILFLQWTGPEYAKKHGRWGYNTKNVRFENWAWSQGIVVKRKNGKYYGQFMTEKQHNWFMLKWNRDSTKV